MLKKNIIYLTFGIVCVVAVIFLIFYTEKQRSLELQRDAERKIAEVRSELEKVKSQSTFYVETGVSGSYWCPECSAKCILLDDGELISHKIERDNYSRLGGEIDGVKENYNAIRLEENAIDKVRQALLKIDRIYRILEINNISPGLTPPLPHDAPSYYFFARIGGKLISIGKYSKTESSKPVEFPEAEELREAEDVIDEVMGRCHKYD